MPLLVLPVGLATLLIAGDHDDHAPSDRLASAINPKVVVVPGVDHFWSAD
jgi:pimeloyl-ACP methyl ester carboxylesterase